MKEQSFNEIMNDFNEKMDKLIMEEILKQFSNEKLEYSEIRNNLKVFVDAIQVKKNNAAEIYDDLVNAIEIIKTDEELRDKYYTKMIEDLGLQCDFTHKSIK